VYLVIKIRFIKYRFLKSTFRLRGRKISTIAIYKQSTPTFLSANITEFVSQTEDEQAQKAKNEQESLDRLLSLFSECKIFLSREVPRESLVFIIRYWP
jgi:hypothetical protein